MSLFVVRHAKAGSRRDWDGDDSLRPLTRAGRRQAEAVAARLADEGVSGLWSSPSTRCVQTLEPLGRTVGLPVQPETRLGEGTPFEDVLAVVASVSDGAVLCSHGDTIPELLEALVRRGTEVLTPPDWRKASIWVLDTPDADGRVAAARAEPPPTERR